MPVFSAVKIGYGRETVCSESHGTRMSDNSWIAFRHTLSSVIFAYPDSQRVRQAMVAAFSRA
jgi:hypothetical protein